MLKNKMGSEQNQSLLRTELSDIFNKVVNRQINDNSISNDILFMNLHSDAVKSMNVIGKMAHKNTHFKMRIGQMWEIVFTLFGFQKLPTGLDVINYDRKIIIELKNNWKTDNYSGKKFKFAALRNYKRDHPDFEVIYGCVNDFKIRDYINTDGVRVLTGHALLRHILAKDMEFVVETLQSLISDYIIHSLSKDV